MDQQDNFCHPPRAFQWPVQSRLVGQVLSRSIFYSETWCRVVWQEFTNILKDPAASIFRLCGHHILKDSIFHSHHHKNFWSHSLLTLGTGNEFLYGSPVQMGHRFPSTRHVRRPLWITNLFSISQRRLFRMDTLVLTMFKCFQFQYW